MIMDKQIKQVQEISSLIEGSYFKNENFMLSFFNQIEDEPNLQLFLLDYQDELDEKSLTEEIDSLIKILIDLEFISLLKTKKLTETYKINGTNITFICEKNSKRKNVKKKLQKTKANPAHVFNRIEEVIEQEVNVNGIGIGKQFFKHLEEKAIIVDFYAFEREFRPSNVSEPLIDDVDMIDLVKTMAEQGLVNLKERKNNKLYLSIRDTDIVFTINDLNDIKETKKRNLSKRQIKKNITKNLQKKRTPKKVIKEKPFEMTEDEINERALSVINSALKNSTDEVINIFEKISLPFNGANYKRQLFEKIFELAEIDGEWRDDIGYVIFSKKRTKKAVVSHMDLISPFNRGFAKGRVYKIEDEKLIGALDNTFTNAVVINSILNNRADDTTYLFTLDEETTQYAIRDYMKLFGTEQFIINLDITNEGMKNNMAIEYDEPSWEICKQINENMDSPFFTKDRVCDDMDEVVKANGYGFSYCVPSGKTIHSYNNYTYLDKIKPYMEGLEFLIHELDVSECKENIKHISIKKALKCNTLKKLKKKDVRKTPKRRTTSGRTYDNGSENTNYYYDHHQGTLALYDDETRWDEDEGLSDFASESDIASQLANVIIYIGEETVPDNYSEYQHYINTKIFSDEAFEREELIYHSNEKTFSVLLASDLIGEMSSGLFVFNKSIVETSKFQFLKEAMTKAPKLNFVKLAKFLAGIEDSFKAEDLNYMHTDKDKKDHIQKINDYKELINSGLTRGFLENTNGRLIFPD